MVQGQGTLRERKKLETRLALARAALRLFEERGYAETTIDDIAAAANVSRRTFFRYFACKDEAVIVDPAGKVEALRIALEDGPPEEPTIAALRRGILALTRTYFQPDLIRADRSPGTTGACLRRRAMAYQVRWEDELAAAVAVDLGVDIARLRPRIVAHTTVAVMQAGFAAWFAEGGRGDPATAVADTFDRTNQGARGGARDARGIGRRRMLGPKTSPGPLAARVPGHPVLGHGPRGGSAAVRMACCERPVQQTVHPRGSGSMLAPTRHHATAA